MVYNEALRFEISCLNEPVDVLAQNPFAQFVFDSADVNIDTIDGNNTIHAIGGIQCATLKPLGSDEAIMERARPIYWIATIGEFGKDAIIAFQKQVRSLWFGIFNLIPK